MKTKLTDWHSGDVKPVHEGVYKRQMTWCENFSYYCNGLWYGYAQNEQAALSNFRDGFMSEYQNSPWCGLANKPRVIKRP